MAYGLHVAMPSYVHVLFCLYFLAGFNGVGDHAFDSCAGERLDW